MFKPSILVIDDEPQIRKFLKIALESTSYQFHEAKTGDEGLTLAAAKNPDLVILDLGLPDQDGQVVLIKLREWFLNPVIILSVRNDDESVVSALDSGASDYIRKPFSLDELLARIRVCLRKKNAGSSEPVLKFGDLVVDLNKHLVFLREGIIKMTATEYELLKLLVIHRGKVLTHSFILKSIWGPNAEKHTHYLRVYMSHLRQKIENEISGGKLIVTEPSVGYRFVA